jgi:hypothetical protein
MVVVKVCEVRNGQERDQIEAKKAVEKITG